MAVGGGGRWAVGLLVKVVERVGFVYFSFEKGFKKRYQSVTRSWALHFGFLPGKST